MQGVRHKERMRRKRDRCRRETEREQVVVVWGFKYKTQQQLMRDTVPLNFKMSMIVCVCACFGEFPGLWLPRVTSSWKGPFILFLCGKEGMRAERMRGSGGVTQCQMAGCGVTGAGWTHRKWEGQTQGDGLWAGFRVCSLAHPWCMNRATAVYKIIRWNI